MLLGLEAAELLALDATLLLGLEAMLLLDLEAMELLALEGTELLALDPALLLALDAIILLAEMDFLVTCVETVAMQGLFNAAEGAESPLNLSSGLDDALMDNVGCNLTLLALVTLACAMEFEVNSLLAVSVGGFLLSHAVDAIFSLLEQTARGDSTICKRAARCALNCCLFCSFPSTVVGIMKVPFSRQHLR